MVWLKLLFILASHSFLLFRYSDVSIADCMEYLRYPGFRKLALNNASFGVEEFFKSMFLQLQLKKLRQFIPQITAVDLKK